MGGGHDFNQKEIAKFSAKDAQAYPKYEAMLANISEFLDLLIDEPPVDPAAANDDDDHDDATSSFLARSPLLRGGQLSTLFKVGRGLAKLGRDIPDMVEICTAPASRILDRWFESDVLKSTLATDAVIGAMVSPSTPGSGYVLMHHCMGEAVKGKRGSWYYVRGGMGALSEAVAAAARKAGAKIETNKAVKSIILASSDSASASSASVKGVVLEDGTEIRAQYVLSNLNADYTFFKLIDPSDLKRGVLPERFVRDLKSFDYTSATFKINLAVDRLPNFRAFPNDPHNANEPGPQHRGTIHLVHSMAEIEAGYKEAYEHGRPSSRPIIEMTIPSAVDPTLVSKPGTHVVQLFVQYAPYHLRPPSSCSSTVAHSGPLWPSWDDEGRKQAFADSCYRVIEEYAPGFTESIVGQDLLSPLDLERVFGLKGGNIFHGAMGLDQLYWKRPLGGYSRYRTPIRNYYLCGSSAHPGGGVMGAAGRNAARIVLNDMQKNNKKKK
eukprot:GEZU01042188.1.p1 GENE.GEZU01042188.1~~GEZU01042188.1.p1  ORF type:complete len:495 (-),score=156.64 GEZU01042188.1:120-1604(-)